MATTEERTFIEMRQEGYRQAHNSLDVSTLLSWMSQDIDYSDHGIGVVHISKSGLHDLATAVFSSVKDMVFTTVSLNGTKSFTAWEWIAKGTLLKEIPGIPLKVGDEFESMGCSLFWWKEGGWGGGEYFEDGGVFEICWNLEIALAIENCDVWANVPLDVEPSPFQAECSDSGH